MQLPHVPLNATIMGFAEMIDVFAIKGLGEMNVKSALNATETVLIEDSATAMGSAAVMVDMQDRSVK